MKNRTIQRQQEAASRKAQLPRRQRTWTPEQLAAKTKLDELYARKRAERDYPEIVLKRFGL